MFPVAHVSVPVLYLASLSKHSLGTGLAQSEGNPSCSPPPTIGIRLHPHRIRRWHHSQQGCTGVGGAGGWVEVVVVSQQLGDIRFPGCVGDAATQWVA